MEMSPKFDPKKNKYLVKVVVLGDVFVGKTNIIRRILKQDYKEMEATIGVEFAYITVPNIDKENPDVNLCIEIWDTSGAERYRAITTAHIRKADGAFLVYDVSNQLTFQSLDYWYETIKNSADEDIVIYLLGNKRDLVYEVGRAVEKSEAAEFVKIKGLSGFSECSAKTNENIEQIFRCFCETLYMKNKQKLKDKTQRRVEYNKRLEMEKNQNRCCEI